MNTMHLRQPAARCGAVAKRAGDTLLHAALSIEFSPAAGGRARRGQSIGTKIAWRGLSPDDLVMWPLPVVSSTKTISPAPI